MEAEEGVPAVGEKSRSRLAVPESFVPKVARFEAGERSLRRRLFRGLKQRFSKICISTMLKILFVTI